MAAPTLAAVGGNVTSAAAIAMTAPSGIAVGNLLVAVMESSGLPDSYPLLNPSGSESWELIETVVQGGTRATMYMALAERTTIVAPTISDSGDHQTGRIFRVAGNHVGAYPSDCIHKLSKFYDPTSDTSGSFPATEADGSAMSTTIAECLIFYWCVGDLPDATGTAEHSAQANANLSGVTEQSDNTVVSGNGGATTCVTGTLNTPGAIGTLTYTKVSASVKTGLMVAIMPPQGSKFPERPHREQLLAPGFKGPGVDLGRRFVGKGFA